MKKIDYYVHRFCGSGVQTGHSRMCVLSLFCNIWSWKTQNWELESSEDSFTLAVVAVRWLGRLQFLSIWVSPCDISKWTSLCFLEWATRVPQSMHSKEREPGRSCPLYDIAREPRNIISFSCFDGQNRHKSTKFKGRKKDFWWRLRIFLELKFPVIISFYLFNNHLHVI